MTIVAQTDDGWTTATVQRAGEVSTGLVPTSYVQVDEPAFVAPLELPKVQHNVC